MSNIQNREQLLNDPIVLEEIQKRAYFIAESTGFTPGSDHDNWVAAEAEVLEKLMANDAANGVANGTAKPVKAPAKKAAPKAAKTLAAPVETPDVVATPTAATTKATPAKRVAKKSA